ncbi:MAG: cyclic pyranopterin monophosphate synthase MoaC [Candidatus Heimdallarchaeota archaeon]
MVEMVDISKKPLLFRMAAAMGVIMLKPETLTKIRERQIKKGDPFTIAGIAATNAVKKTPDLIPLCHQVPITDVKSEFTCKEDRVEVRVTVKSVGQTGVEMEALIGVCTALATVWDMVKYLEKDKRGQYPTTSISQIRVTQKIKVDLGS